MGARVEMWVRSTVVLLARMGHLAWHHLLHASLTPVSTVCQSNLVC